MVYATWTQWIVNNCTRISSLSDAKNNTWVVGRHCSCHWSLNIAMFMILLKLMSQRDALSAFDSSRLVKTTRWHFAINYEIADQRHRPPRGFFFTLIKILPRSRISSPDYICLHLNEPSAKLFVIYFYCRTFSVAEFLLFHVFVDNEEHVDERSRHDIGELSSFEVEHEKSSHVDSDYQKRHFIAQSFRSSSWSFERKHFARQFVNTKHGIHDITNFNSRKRSLKCGN